MKDKFNIGVEGGAVLRRTAIVFFFIAFWVGSFTLLKAQKTEGMVVYNIGFSRMPEGMPPEMAGMMPSSMTVRFKPNASNTTTSGGPQVQEVLVTDKEAYMISRESKTFTKIKTDGAANSSSSEPKVKKTTETAKVAGLNCTKYEVEYLGNTAFIWATNEIKAVSGNMGNGVDLSKNIDGFPLKMSVEQMGGTFEMVATKVDFTAQDEKFFKLPEGFKEKAASQSMDPEKMRKMMEKMQRDQGGY